MGEIANKLDFNTHCQWDLSPTYRLIMQIYFSYFHPIIKGTHSQSYTNVVQFNDQLSITSVNLVHNAQVCYFNNVWFMFLIF